MSSGPGGTTSSRGRRVGRSLDEDALDRVRGYHATEPYAKAMRKRKVWIEPLFAEAKAWHGLRHFRLRGSEKVNIQAQLIAAGQDLKRLLSRWGWGRRLWPSGAARDATVTAQRAVGVRWVTRSAFLGLLRQEPAVVEGVLRTLAGLVRAGNARHARLLLLDVPGRLALWLLARGGDGTGSGAGVSPGTVVVLGRHQAELAAELGATRSTLNRALQGFAELGLVTVTGDRVVLCHPRGLAAYGT